MTSLENHTGRPEIDPWLRGWIENDKPQTAVVWRTHLPMRVGGREPRKQEVEAFFEAAPPHTSEILETETFRVLEWLRGRAKVTLERQAIEEESADDRAEPLSNAGGGVVGFILARDGDLRRALRLRDCVASGDVAADKKRLEDLDASLRGATLVVHARLAGLTDGLLNDQETVLPQTADDGQTWVGDVGFRVRYAGADEPATDDANWRERRRFVADVSREGEPLRCLIVDKWRDEAATEEDRSAGHPQLLERHQSWAEERARALAKRLDVGEYEEMLATVAALHDEGKRHWRWQQAFRAPADGSYAKTKGPIDYALLDGYRHELGTLTRVTNHERLVVLSDEHRDLALHLIAAHHGFARPIIATRGCEDLPPSALAERAQEIALRFARLQKRWGPWGLAWWESVLRAADQQASKDNDSQAGETKI
jgi:CRISPR-associated endonuclease/helicase Cas3